MKKLLTLTTVLLLLFSLFGCTQSKEDAPIQTVSPAVTSAKTKIPKEPAVSAQSETQPVFRQDLDRLDDDMKHVIEFLTENKHVQMATVGADGKPAIRTIQFQFFENGRIYFQTDKNASIYKELQDVPYIEFVSTKKDDTETLRIKAEVKFEYNYELIDRVLTMGPNIKKIYGSSNNPILIMFYIEHGSASIYEFSDKMQGKTLQNEW